MENKNCTDSMIENITFKASSQSIGHREIYKTKKGTFKLELLSDAYEKQCYARAYVLNGLEWVLLYSIPPMLMNTKNGLLYLTPYTNNIQNAKKEFADDVILMKRRIEEIL